MIRIALHWQILAAILLGIAAGFFFPQYTGYVSWMGTLFLRLLKMVVIPLIFCTLVSAITGLRGEGKLGRIGGKAAGLYVLTTLAAILTALVFVNIFRPGTGIALPQNQDTEIVHLQPAKPIQETLLGIFPENPFSALANADMLPIVVFALLFGIFLSRTRNKTEPQNASVPLETLVQVFKGCDRVMMQMTVFVMMLAPLGVFGMIAESAAKFSGDSEMLKQLGSGLGWHCITILSGLVFHSIITLSVLLYLAGCSPWKHLCNMSSVILTAFSTASSNATLPLTIEETMKNDGVSEEIAGFVLPFGAAVNMNGTALYECAVVFFIANAYGVELPLFQQIITVLMVMLTAIGTAGIPMGSIVMIGIILQTVGLPAEAIGLIIAVDRPLDMCRTVLNVYSDTCCCAAIAKKEGETLRI
ncbi:sodium:dicarboxylate symporter [Planctomycetales bacterium]|nr:sodium:dicarboxylate symporter [Planctomycetales bacterium]